ncbi:MAG: GDSL-type esterase/lipase family protein [Chitinophagaceae bacterium]
MSRISIHTIAFVFFLLPVIALAQPAPMPADDNSLTARYPFVSTVFNRIFNSSGLDSFYHKLYRLRTTNTGTVSIVHIGDSHIQAGSLSGVVRTGLQDFFGDAGRGLVFPYQLARSNAPDDIGSTSNNTWQFNRVAHPEIPLAPGISGFAITSTSPVANIDLFIKSTGTTFPAYNRLKFFTDSNTSVSWILQAAGNGIPYIIRREDGDTSLYQEIQLQQPVGSFTLSSLPSGADKTFYGVSLENSRPGVLYHTIGVNGARYDQYNLADLFWQQLPGLKADLFIISLGTNEAQRAAFAEAAFFTELSVFLQNLKKAAPGAAILITTAPDSYKGRHSNAVLRSLNVSLTEYCNRNYLPLWDLYRITNGYGSAYSWVRRGLMARDRVHFTTEGYRLQGSLLLNALARGYNNYISIF